jgi:hypothetical protein
VSSAQEIGAATVTSPERVYFAAVGLLATWVGFPLFLAPSNASKVLPFSVPPLHARFIGAVYLSGFTLMLGGLFARRWSTIRFIPLMTAVWTGGLLIVTLLHHTSFDFDKTQTQVWFGAYVVYPLVGIWLHVRRHRAGAGEPGPVPASWLCRGLTVQGLVLTAVGLALFVAPDTMADGWPWPAPSLLVQIYAAPLLSYGIGSLLLSRTPSWDEMRVGVVGIGLFAVLAAIGSLIHLELFARSDLAAWAWFGALAAVAALASLFVLTPKQPA